MLNTHHLNFLFISAPPPVKNLKYPVLYSFINFLEQVTPATLVAKTQIAPDVLRTDGTVINPMAASNAK